MPENSANGANGWTPQLIRLVERLGLPTVLLGVLLWLVVLPLKQAAEQFMISEHVESRAQTAAISEVSKAIHESARATEALSVKMDRLLEVNRGILRESAATND